MSDREGTDQLPSTREQIFDYIVAYKLAHNGNSPSMREIAEANNLGLSSVRFHLTRLQIQNRINVLNNRSRTIEVVGSSWHPPEGHDGTPKSESGDEESDGLDTEDDRPWSMR